MSTLDTLREIHADRTLVTVTVPHYVLVMPQHTLDSSPEELALADPIFSAGAVAFRASEVAGIRPGLTSTFIALK